MKNIKWLTPIIVIIICSCASVKKVTYPAGFYFSGEASIDVAGNRVLLKDCATGLSLDVRGEFSGDLFDAVYAHAPGIRATLHGEVYTDSNAVPGTVTPMLETWNAGSISYGEQDGCTTVAGRYRYTNGHMSVSLVLSPDYTFTRINYPGQEVVQGRWRLIDPLRLTTIAEGERYEIVYRIMPEGQALIERENKELVLYREYIY